MVRAVVCVATGRVVAGRVVTWVTVLVVVPSGLTVTRVCAAVDPAGASCVHGCVVVCAGRITLADSVGMVVITGMTVVPVSAMVVEREGAGCVVVTAPPGAFVLSVVVTLTVPVSCGGIGSSASCSRSRSTPQNTKIRQAAIAR